VSDIFQYREPYKFQPWKLSIYGSFRSYIKGILHHNHNRVLINPKEQSGFSSSLGVKALHQVWLKQGGRKITHAPPVPNPTPELPQLAMPKSLPQQPNTPKFASQNCSPACTLACPSTFSQQSGGSWENLLFFK